MSHLQTLIKQYTNLAEELIKLGVLKNPEKITDLTLIYPTDKRAVYIYFCEQTNTYLLATYINKDKLWMVFNPIGNLHITYDNWIRTNYTLNRSFKSDTEYIEWLNANKALLTDTLSYVVQC